MPPRARRGEKAAPAGSPLNGLEHKATRRRRKGKKRAAREAPRLKPGGKPLVSCRTWLFSHGARGGEAADVVKQVIQEGKEEACVGLQYKV